jgi:undecaprenyl-diphosphatase
MLNQIIANNTIPANLIIFGAKYFPFVLGGALLILWFKGRHVLVFKACVALAIGIALAEVIKSFFYTPRPFVAESVNALFPMNADGSFPSTHTTGLAAMATALLRKARVLGTILFAGALGVGVCRVLAYVHYPRDVLGGAFLGVAVGLGVTLARDYFSSKE